MDEKGSYNFNQYYNNIKYDDNYNENNKVNHYNNQNPINQNVEFNNSNQIIQRSNNNDEEIDGININDPHIQKIVLNEFIRMNTNGEKRYEFPSEKRLILFTLLLLKIFIILFAIIMFIVAATTIYSITLLSISSIITIISVCNVILVGWAFFNLDLLFEKNGHVFFTFSLFCLIITFFVSWIVIILHSTQLSIMTILSNLSTNVQLLMVFHGIVFVCIFFTTCLLIHLISKQKK